MIFGFNRKIQFLKTILIKLLTEVVKIPQNQRIFKMHEPGVWCHPRISKRQLFGPSLAEGEIKSYWQYLMKIFYHHGQYEEREVSEETGSVGLKILRT